MERAGVDIITDGEIRRESYSNRFATALDGIDLDNPGRDPRAAPASPTTVPRVVGPIRRREPVEVRDLEFLRAQHRPPDQDHAARPVHDEPAGRRRALRRRRARWRWTSRSPSTRRSATCSPPAPTSSRSTSRSCSRGPSRPAQYAIEVINRALDGRRRHDRAAHLLRLRARGPRPRRPRLPVPGRARRLRRRPDRRSRPPSRSSTSRVLERSPDKTILLGVLDLGDRDDRDAPRSSPTASAPRCGTSTPSGCVVAPDCGMKYLPRDVAVGKLAAMVRGAESAPAVATRPGPAARPEAPPARDAGGAAGRTPMSAKRHVARHGRSQAGGDEHGQLEPARRSRSRARAGPPARRSSAPR